MLAGRYEIIKQLGGGGFAITFLAIDHMQPSKPKCVVKQLRPNQAGDPRVIAFFEKEAEVLETLGTHPQIPRLLASFQEKQCFYMVQEWIDGRDLSYEIQPGKQLSESYALKVLQEVLEILAFVHQRKVIHRDIKPDNLMRQRADGKLFLIDFGAVKQLTSIQINAQGQTQLTAIIGTPGYMPWEQSKGRPVLNSDLYALGVTVIAALTGLLPDQFQEDPQTGEILWQQNARASPALADFLSRLVRHRSVDRFPSAREALDALNQLTQPTIAPGSSPISSPASSPVASAQPSPTSAPNPQPQAKPLSPGRPVASPAPQPILGNKPPVLAKVTRRGWLKWAGISAGSVAATILGREWLLPLSQRPEDPLPSLEPTSSPTATPEPLPPPSPTPEPPPPPTGPGGIPLERVSLDNTVRLNDRGEVVEEIPVSVTVYNEDLGDGITLRMVEIPEGTFTMGSPEEEEGRNSVEGPQRQVTVPSFFMGMFTVTQAQYEAVMGENPATESDRDRFVALDKPVINVSWNDAVAFCDRLSQQTGRTYRLPSEAEWEYACRAGTETPFHFGETLTTDLANYDGNGTYGDAPQGEYRQRTTTVGRFPANAFGLFEMHGNVLEWCLDHWHDNYQGAPTDGSAWIVGGNSDRRVLRGGSWNYYPIVCRSALRLWFGPGSLGNDVGFRVVCVSA